jgi:serine/threonine-protein kinase
MGIVMYETLAGRPPFKERTTIETIRRQIKEAAPKFSEVDPTLVVPDALEKIVLKCLLKNPDERYQTMEELRNELENFAAAVVPSAAPHISATSVIKMPAASSGRTPVLATAEKSKPPYTTAIIVVLLVLLALAAFKLFVH